MSIKEDTEQRLIKTLSSFLQPDVEVEVEADEQGVLRSFTLVCIGARSGNRFTVYGDDWTWES